MRTLLAILFIGAFIVVGFTYDDYGIIWDDQPHSTYGEYALEFFKSGFQDKRYEDYLNLRYYGPLPDLSGAALAEFTPLSRYDARHLLAALSGILTAIGLCFYAKRAQIIIPLFAALALFMLPRFYGHSFFNLKDIPFACAMTWTMVAACRFFTVPQKRWSDTFFLAVTVGLTAAVRPAGLVVVLVFMLAIYFYQAIFLLRSERKYDIENQMQILMYAMGGAVVTWLVLIALWPPAYSDPLRHPWTSIVQALNFPEKYIVLFEGVAHDSEKLPAHYLIKYIAITTPPALLTLFLIGFVRAIRLAWGMRQLRKGVIALIPLVWFIVPIVLFAVTRPTVYDGIRQFLFLLPAVALMIGLGASWLYDIARERLTAPITIAALLLLLLSPAIPLSQLHPYQMTYFNTLTGGMEKASERYDTDYWLSSYRDAAEWINEDAERRGLATPVIELAANGYSETCAAHFLSPDTKLLWFWENGIEGEIPGHVDYYIGTTREHMDKNYPETPVVYQVERLGAVYVVVKGRDK